MPLTPLPNEITVSTILSVLSIISVTAALVSAIMSFYTSAKLATFKHDLIKELNGTYVRAESFRMWQDALQTNLRNLSNFHNQDHERIGKLEDRVIRLEVKTEQ